MTISPKTVWFDEDSMWVGLNDARVIGVPLAWFPRLSNDRSMDPLNDRLLDPPHQPLEGLVRWVCDEPASLKERREKLLSTFRANGFHGVV